MTCAPPGAGTSRHRHAAFQRGGKGVAVGSKVIVGGVGDLEPEAIRDS